MAKDLSPSTHPLTPPLTEEEWLPWLRLLRSHRVGVTTFFRLMTEYGSADAALRRFAGNCRRGRCQRIPACGPEVAHREWDAARQRRRATHGNRLTRLSRRLADISDAPPFLWCIGDTSLLQPPVTRLGRCAKRLIAWHPHGPQTGRRTGRGRLYHRLGSGPRHRHRRPHSPLWTPAPSPSWQAALT